MPNGLEEHGASLQKLASYVESLMFDSGIEGADYGIAGSCFLVKYNERLFVVTANHCLAKSNGDDLRIALNPSTKSFLPLKQLHRAQSNPPNQDWSDIAIFEAAPELLSVEEQLSLNSLDLTNLRVSDMVLRDNAKLVVPSYPKCLNEVDFDRFVIHTQRYLPSGSYVEQTKRDGVHLMRFDEMDQIEHPDGMSGSPVFFIENYPEGHYFGFLGMMIHASKPFLAGEFICAPVVFQMLDKIISENQQST